MGRSINSFELAHTSMCVWENVQSRLDTDSALGNYLLDLQSEIGITNLRGAMVDFSSKVEDLYQRIGSLYHEPFDMEFVPGLITVIFNLCGHLGVRQTEELNEYTMLVAWVFMNTGASIGEVIEGKNVFTVRHSTTVVTEWGPEIVEFREDGNYGRDCVPRHDSFFSLNMANNDAPRFVLADFPTAELADMAKIGILVMSQEKAEREALYAA